MHVYFVLHKPCTIFARIIARVHAPYTRNEKQETKKHKDMNIETTLVQSVVEAIKSLYGTDFSAEKIQLQKTRKEFEGDFTLVVFPFLALSKKRPEETAQEIGEFLKASQPVALFAGYIGIIFGHKSNNFKAGKSVLYGFIAYMIPQIITIGIIFILGLFNKDIMNLLNTTTMINVEAIKSIMYVGIIIYLCYIAIYYLIGKRQFEKGVNVD